MKGNSAVYAGTFDPITFGHCDIVERALHIFDSLVIAVAEGNKSGGVFSVAERVSLVEQSLAGFADRVRVEAFSGLLVDYAKKRGMSVVVRGLRAVSDYEYESQMAMTNRQLSPDLETIFLMTSWKYSFVSSSTVREVARNAGDVSSLVPDAVTKALMRRFPCQK
ncbi:MAG: pantetheine-phosphate adenylyltransferase [bacterium]|nr:pantetheine-phosphate adenylyltransferase [bacterium]